MLAGVGQEKISRLLGGLHKLFVGRGNNPMGLELGNGAPANCKGYHKDDDTPGSGSISRTGCYSEVLL